MNLIDKVFGVSPQVLSIRSQRTELIAANLANADTPGYKAKDIDFAAVMAGARGMTGLSKSHDRHFASEGGSFGAGAAELRYRVPVQPSLDGNTVQTDLEHAEFMENAIRYQASLNFLDGRIKSMVSALKGE